MHVSTICFLLQGGPCYRCMFPTPPPLETVTGMYPRPHMTCMYPPPHITCMYPPPHMTCMYPPPLMTCMNPPLETVTGTLHALLTATQLNTNTVELHVVTLCSTLLYSTLYCRCVPRLQKQACYHHHHYYYYYDYYYWCVCVCVCVRS